jgi:hypothetical protein
MLWARKLNEMGMSAFPGNKAKIDSSFRYGPFDMGPIYANNQRPIYKDTKGA